MTDTREVIDVRTVPPPQRHGLIFATFDALPTGGALELLNDHDPLPLYFQFETRRNGQFDWRYLENGPEQWQVRIGKLRQGPTDAPQSSCGGACGGSGG